MEDPEPPMKKKRRGGGLAKRAPYVLAACDQCHDRKLKCSGAHPCERCKKQGVSCNYPVEARPPHMPAHSSIVSGDLLSNIQELQSQLGAVKAQLQSLTTGTSHMPISPSPTSSAVANGSGQDGHDLYAGPTSSTYSLNAADSILSNIQESNEADIDLNEDPAEMSEMSSPKRKRHQSSVPFTPTNDPKPSMEALNTTQVSDYIDTFQNVFGVLHPISYLSDIQAQSPHLLRAVKRSLWSEQKASGTCGLNEMFKMVIAVAEVCKAGSPTPLSRALYQSVEPILGSAAFARTITHEFRILLLLVAFYHFSCDDLALGTRALMIASRTAVEEGLYRRETLTIKYPYQSERDSVLNVLWSIFILDMQFNYAAGLPNLLNENHVDLPSPVDAPYLSAMVEYVFLGAQAWTSIVKRDILLGGRAPSQDALDFFHYQLDRWRQRLHPSVRFDAEEIDHDSTIFITRQENTSDVYLKSLLYLRSNQVQILVLRPVLMRLETATSSPVLAKQVVSIARRSIRVLHQLSVKSNLYRKRQMVFNHFLGSSMTVLFLAAALDAVQKTSPRTPTTASLLQGNAHELRLGLDLIDEYQSTRLLQCFDRPRKQLARLQMLEKGKDHGNDGSSLSNERQTQDTHGFVGGFDIEPGTDFSTLDLDDSLFSFDWFNAEWSDSAGPFGVTSWI